MSARPARLVVGLALLAGACTNVTRVGVGPVAAFPDDEGASYGDELVVRRGIGTSDFASITAFEYEARALVTERSQALSLGAGPSYLPWLGPVLASMSLAPAVGIERVHEKVLGNLGLHGALGLGVTLSESFREARSASLPPDVISGDGGYLTQARDRTLLGLELTGSVDVRGTRSPLLGLGLLVALTFTAERRELPLPDLPPTPFGLPFAPRE